MTEQEQGSNEQDDGPCGMYGLTPELTEKLDHWIELEGSERARNRLFQRLQDRYYEAGSDSERALAAKEWVLYARAETGQLPRQACAVCNEHQSIAHAHHVVPLAMQSHGGWVPSHHLLWLCPNHHALVHRLIELLRDGHLDRVPMSKRTRCILNDLAQDDQIDQIRVIAHAAFFSYMPADGEVSAS